MSPSHPQPFTVRQKTSALLARLRLVLSHLQSATGLPETAKSSILWELAIAYNLLASGWSPESGDTEKAESLDLLPAMFDEVSVPGIEASLLTELRELESAWTTHVQWLAKAA